MSKTPKFSHPEDRHWKPVDVRGTTMETCPLWEGGHGTCAGLYRMPAGMRIERHLHARWVQVFVVEGAMRVDDDGGGVHTVDRGGYYFVEPGESHVETALRDTVVLVVEDEEPDATRQDRPGA